MSSDLRARSLLAFGVVAAVAMGCGRSPAMPRAPLQLVRVESGSPPPVVVDDDDDDDFTPPVGLKKSRPVQYVHMSEWQPPPSAQRAENEVAAAHRGGGSGFTKFPLLTLHKPIGDTSVWGRTWHGGRVR